MADLDDERAIGRVRRAAVVVHPGKHNDLDGFRGVVAKAMSDLGWAEPLWLETSPYDAGQGLTRTDVAAGHRWTRLLPNRA